MWATMFSDKPYVDAKGRWLVPDPVLGFRLNPAVEGVNSIGIRHVELSPEKQEGKMRIVVLGDSVAWEKNGFVSQLGDRLGERAEVVNAAIPGYTTYQERMLFEQELLPLNPDLLILQYCLNDNHQFLHHYRAEGGMLFTEEARRVLLPEEGEPLWWLPNWSYLGFRLRIAYARWRTPKREFPWEESVDFAPGWQDKRWEPFREHLRAMRNEMTEIGGRITVVMFPVGSQYRADLLEANRDYMLKPQRLMKAICEDLNVPLLDMYPVLAKHGGKELLPDNIHLNAKGHEIAVEVLLEHLTAGGLVALAGELAP